MTTPSTNARLIAEKLNVSDIPSERSPLHAAVRTAEIEKQAIFLDALAEQTGFNLADTAKSFAA